MLNVVLIGCGRISYKHIEALAKNRIKFRLIAVCDLLPERAEERKLQYESLVQESDLRVYTDYKEMFDLEDIDMAVIATESGKHYEQSMYCIGRGKHVLVEKPMALSLDEADQMIKMAILKGVKLGVCHQNRFNPAIRKLRRAVEEGRFGKIINITARILWNRNEEYYRQADWRGTRALDGGTLMNQCIHNIDLLRWMMNSEVERLYCERDTFLRDIEMEDFGAILIRFKNRAIGVIEGSACVYPRNLEETLSVFGEKGTAVIGGLAVNEIKVWEFEDQCDDDIEGKTENIENVYGNGHIPLYRDFAESVETGRETYVSGIEGRKALEIVIQAYEVSGGQ